MSLQEGRAPLHEASRLDHRGAVEVLLAHKADVAATDKVKMTGKG